MSFQASTWALKRRTGSPSAKAVLMALANYAGENGSCYVSVGRLAEDTEQSGASVRRRIKELAAIGLIARLERFRDNGSQSSSTYVVLHDEVAFEFAKSQGWNENSVVSVDIDDIPEAVPPLADCKGGGVANCKEPPCTGERGPLSLLQPLEQTLEQLPEPSPIAPTGGCADEDLQKRWEAFKAVYPWREGDRPEKARRLFETMSMGDQLRAVRYAPAYGSACIRDSRKVMNGVNWLRDKGWEVFAMKGDAPPPRRVVIIRGTPQAAAWAEYRKWENGGRSEPLFFVPMTLADGRRVDGRYEDTEYPPSRRLKTREGGRVYL